ncbi:MAG: hypothetical protein LUG18_07390 [Candidatus Azobacteroides sp.]|nr:hypothetical protein [Candidatus Azobacteroides sp.]
MFSLYGCRFPAIKKAIAPVQRCVQEQWLTISYRYISGSMLGASGPELYNETVNFFLQWRQYNSSTPVASSDTSTIRRLHEGQLTLLYACKYTKFLTEVILSFSFFIHSY